MSKTEENVLNGKTKCDVEVKDGVEVKGSKVKGILFLSK